MMVIPSEHTRIRAPLRVARFAALLAALATLAAARPALAAGEAAGTAAGSFLSVGSGASAMSMAGATLASGRDLAAAAWNPASLARVDVLQFSLTHAPLPGGATQEWLAAGGRVGGGETRWGFQTLFQREGGIEGRDASNNPTGSLSASDLAVGARVAHRFAGRVDVGVGGEWVHQSLASASGSGFAFEAGVRTDAGPIGLAVAARHLGGGMNYGGTRYDLPAVIAAGASWSDAALGLRVNADFESPTHYYQAVRVGGEWMWRGQVALRAGYRSELGGTTSERLSGPTFGLGTGTGGVWLDYAFAPQGDVSAGQHRVGLTFSPGRGDRTDAQAVATPRPKPAPVKAPAREPERDREPTVAKPAPAKPPAATKSAPAPTPPPATLTPGPVPSLPPAPATPEATSPAPGSSSTEPAKPEVRPTTVTLGHGETLADLARKWNTTVPAIMMLNNLVSERVQPGTKLKLPPPNRR